MGNKLTEDQKNEDQKRKSQNRRYNKKKNLCQVKAWKKIACNFKSTGSTKPKRTWKNFCNLKGSDGNTRECQRAIIRLNFRKTKLKQPKALQRVTKEIKGATNLLRSFGSRIKIHKSGV
jgi:hypothetical protein